MTNFEIVFQGKAYEVSEELYRFYYKSKRQMKYTEKDIKQEKFKYDAESETTTIIPSKEDSLDRLMELGVEYCDSSADFISSLIDKVSLEQALQKLNDKERYIIVQIFYIGKSEKEIAEELNMPYQHVNRSKVRSLKKLRKLLE